MSHEPPKYWKIGSIVDHFLLSNDLPDQYFAKALEWALWGFRELQLDTFQDSTAAAYEVTERKTVDLPGNFVDWVLIAAPVGQYLMTLGINEFLSRAERDGTEVANFFPTAPNGIDIQNYTPYHLSNGMTSYGHGLPNSRKFQIVKRESSKELLLDLNYPLTTVYIEHITDGFEACVETVVNPYFQNYILRYIEAEYEEKNNPNRTQTSIDRKWEQVGFSKIECNGRANQLDKTTMLGIMRKHFKLTPKT